MDRAYLDFERLYLMHQIGAFREHGLHPAKQLGKEPCAGLKNHSPLEGGVGERAEPAVEPSWGGTRRHLSDYQQRTGTYAACRRWSSIFLRVSWWPFVDNPSL